MKIYEALANAFRRENVECCFALLGDANMHWAGALAETGVGFIYTRHEHAAVAAATAYARTTGRVGVATVTCGPGLTQIMTILPIAVRARIPLVIFAGEAPLHKAWYNQGIEQGPFVEACGADYRALHDPNDMISAVHHAFLDASKTQKPIVFGVPFDLKQQLWVHQPQHPSSGEMFVAPSPQQPDQSGIKQAAKWIAAAKRPIVLAGLGAVNNDAKSACIALAEQCGACLATTLPAKGLFHDQSFCLGVAGGYASEAAKIIFSESDLIISIGARLAAHTFDGGNLTPNASVIHIDIDPHEFVQGRKAADLMIASDARLGAHALRNALLQVTADNNINIQQPTLAPPTGWRTEKMRQRTLAALALPDTDTHGTADGLLHPMAVVKKLSQIIPAHCHIVNTSGHCAYYTAQMNKHPQSHYTVIRDFGAIGNGTSFAMGIAAAHSDRPVVLLDGDGSALMNIQELETIARHAMNILIVVLNDGAYGSEVHKLRSDGVNVAGSVFGRADFSGIGDGFGLVGKTFTCLDGLQQCMDEFLSNPAPSIWDIHISDQVASAQILKAHKAAHK